MPDLTRGKGGDEPGRVTPKNKQTCMTGRFSFFFSPAVCCLSIGLMASEEGWM